MNELFPAGCGLCLNTLFISLIVGRGSFVLLRQVKTIAIQTGKRDREQRWYESLIPFKPIAN